MANKCVNAATAAEIISQYTGIPLHQLVDIMAEVPSEDVEPVRHGKWRKLPHGRYNCSNCHCIVNHEEQYCEFCGVLMDGDTSG